MSTKEAKPASKHTKSNMHDLHARVAKLTPRMEAWRDAVSSWEAEEQGLAWLLVKAAWPALRAIAAVTSTEWMSLPLEHRELLRERVFLCDESEPCFRVEERDREPRFLRGEEDISPFLGSSIDDVTREIDNLLGQWERETESDDYLDTWRAETAEMHALRQALWTFEESRETFVAAGLTDDEARRAARRDIELRQQDAQAVAS